MLDEFLEKKFGRVGDDSRLALREGACERVEREVNELISRDQ